MSGAECSVHDNSFVWYCKHSGLNRLSYRLVNMEKWLENIENTDPELEETFWAPEIRRRAKIKYRFRNHYKRE